MGTLERRHKPARQGEKWGGIGRNEREAQMTGSLIDVLPQLLWKREQQDGHLPKSGWKKTLTEDKMRNKIKNKHSESKIKMLKVQER